MKFYSEAKISIINFLVLRELLPVFCIMAVTGIKEALKGKFSSFDLQAIKRALEMVKEFAVLIMLWMLTQQPDSG